MRIILLKNYYKNSLVILILSSFLCSICLIDISWAANKSALRPLAVREVETRPSDVRPIPANSYLALEQCKANLEAAQRAVDPAVLAGFNERLAPFKNSGLLLDDPEEVKEELRSQGVELTPELLRILELERKILALEIVREEKYHEDIRFIKTVALPSEEEGYIVDTLGFPGKWRIGILTKDEDCIERGGILRLTKSLSYIKQRVEEGRQKVDERVFGRTFEFKSIFIVDSVKDIDKFVPRGTIIYQIDEGLYFQITQEDGITKITVFATVSYLSKERTMQRRTLRHFFENTAGYAKMTKRGNKNYRSKIKDALNKRKESQQIRQERRVAYKTCIFLSDNLKGVVSIGSDSYYIEDKDLQDSSLTGEVMRRLFVDAPPIYSSLEIVIEKKYLSDAVKIIRALQRMLYSPDIILKIAEEEVDLDGIDTGPSSNVKVEVNCKGYLDIAVNRFNGVSFTDDKKRELLKIPKVLSQPSDSNGVSVLITGANKKEYIEFFDIEESIGAHLLKEALEKRGYRTHIVRDEESVLYSLANVYCVSTFISNLPETLELIKKIRDNDPKAFIIIGGTGTLASEQILANIPGVDILIRGEGEEVLPQVIEIISKVRDRTELSEEDLEKLSDINGVYVQSGRRVAICNLDKTNFVKKVKVPAIGEIDRTAAVRGCPYDCNFCSKVSGQKYRSASFKEMRDYLIGKLAINLDLPDNVATGIMSFFGITDRVPKSYLGGLKKTNYVIRTPLEKWSYASQDIIALLNIFENARVDDEHFSNWGFVFDKGTIRTISNILGLGNVGDLDKLREALQKSERSFTRRMLQDIIFVFRLQWAKAVMGKNNERGGELLVPGKGYLKDLKAKILIRENGDEMLGAWRMLTRLADWMIENHFDCFVTFGIGQSSIASIYDFKKGRPWYEYLEKLKRGGFFLSSTYGIDGLTNTALRQHNKPRYTIGNVLECYVAGERIGLRVKDDNAVTVNPYSTHTDIAEAAALSFLLPFVSSPKIGIVGYSLGSSFSNENIILFPREPIEPIRGLYYLIRGRFAEYDVMRDAEGNLLIPNWDWIGSLPPDALYKGIDAEEISRIKKEWAIGLFNEHFQEIVRRWEGDVDPEMEALATLFQRFWEGGSSNLSPWQVLEKIKEMASNPANIRINGRKRNDFRYFRYLLATIEQPSRKKRVGREGRDRQVLIEEDI